MPSAAAQSTPRRGGRRTRLARAGAAPTVPRARPGRAGHPAGRGSCPSNSRLGRPTGSRRSVRRPGAVGAGRRPAVSGRAARARGGRADAPAPPPGWTGPRLRRVPEARGTRPAARGRGPEVPRREVHARKRRLEVAPAPRNEDRGDRIVVNAAPVGIGQERGLGADVNSRVRGG